MKPLIVLFSTLLPFLNFSQTGRLKYADKMYEDKSYYYASEAYEDVLDRRTDSSVVAVRIADSYDKIGNTQKAAEWYRFIQRTSQLTKDQQMRLALLERQLENYKESDQLLASYEQKYGGDDLVANVLKSSSSLDALQKDKGVFTIQQQDVNTENSEIGASFYSDDQLLLASSKRRSVVVKRIHSWTGNYFYDLYIAPIDADGKIGKMKLIHSKVKSKFHDGPAVYNEQTGYMYFTRNNYISGKKGMDSENVIRLKIYRAQLEDGKFKNVEELSFNNDEFSTAHPSLSKDGKRLYFSSDRPGGLGGMDLYYVDLDDAGKPVGEPINMGSKINTTQNELFPFYNGEENILFFSSEGHFGLGGLDVFVAKLSKSGTVKSIENLGVPINSSVDDFSFINNEEQSKGYFSSNRQSGKGSDDIYGFIQKSVIKNGILLTGNTKDLLTDNELGNTTIYLADQSGTILDSTSSDDQGAFELDLGDLQTDFQLLGTKDGYIKTSKSISFNAEQSEYKEDLSLMPVLDYHFAGLITDKASNAPLQGVKVTITDNKKNNELFSVENTVSEGTFRTGNLPYSYNDGIDYDFKLEKDGYITKTVSISELLKLKEEINVNEYLVVKMDEIEIGKTDLGDVVSLNPIYFDLNSSYIRSDAALELDKIVKVMKENPRIVIELGSHTDSRASDHYNMWLSDRRAKSSANYIISRGISKDRITGKGYGESRLKVSDAQIEKASTTEEKEALHQMNRRTEFVIVNMK